MGCFLFFRSGSRVSARVETHMGGEGLTGVSSAPSRCSWSIFMASQPWGVKGGYALLHGGAFGVQGGYALPLLR